MKDELSPDQAALMRLNGGGLIASGILIAALCGGCTLNVLRFPGLAPFALVIGGAPTAGGVMLVVYGLKQLRQAGAARTKTAARSMLSTTAGWSFVGLGAVIALVATYQVMLDLWVLLNALTGHLTGPNGSGLAFFAALEHSLLFILSAAAVELGRRIMLAGRS